MDEVGLEEGAPHRFELALLAGELGRLVGQAGARLEGRVAHLDAKLGRQRRHAALPALPEALALGAVQVRQRDRLRPQLVRQPLHLDVVLRP